MNLTTAKEVMALLERYIKLGGKIGDDPAQSMLRIMVRSMMPEAMVARVTPTQALIDELEKGMAHADVELKRASRTTAKN